MVMTIFINHWHRVVVLWDSLVFRPIAVFITDRNQRRVVVHGIVYTCAILFSLYGVVIGNTCINVEWKCQTVVQSFTLYKCTANESVHFCTADNALLFHIVDTGIIGRMFISTGDRYVVIVTDGSALNFILPVYVTAKVVINGEIIGLGIGAQFRSWHHIEVL